MSFWIIGKQPVIEAIKSKSVIIEDICVLKLEQKNFIKNISANEKVRIVEKNFINKVTKIETAHQGFAALIKYKTIKPNNLKLKTLLEYDNYICLDGVTDTRNIGSIIRTCLAFDIESIIINKRNIDQENQAIIKASAGAIFNLELQKVTNLSSAIKFLKKNNYYIYTFGSSSNAFNIKNLKLHKKNIFIFGSEGFGVSQNIIKQSDFEVKLNTSEKMKHLNVSNAISSFLAIRDFIKN